MKHIHAVVALTALVVALAVTETLMALALAPTGQAESPWAPHLRRVEEALAANNTNAAVIAWREAYGAARASHEWEGMLEVGHASLRIGRFDQQEKGSVATARGAYLAALFRARHQRSLDGVLRTAEAFAALGDGEVVAQSIRIAQRLADEANDEPGRARVNAHAQRLTDVAQSFNGRR